MKIGIDASRAFSKQRTGIEEYSYQVIKHLRNRLQDYEVFLYVRKNQKIDFDLPVNWRIKTIKFSYFWTQVGLSLEMLFHPVDTLFIPAHVVPLIHPVRNALVTLLRNGAGGPKKTIVVVHGLEFEVFPEGYSFWARFYMKWSIKMSVKWAKTIIAVSNNTKSDLVKLYGVNENKIQVIYEGVSNNLGSQNSNLKNTTQKSNLHTKYKIHDTKYLLFIGRLEKRKNIEGIIEAFKILKEKYNIPHKLVLAGKPGYGFENIKSQISNLKIKDDINLTGYITEEKKYKLLQNADLFLFPTFYEGFGLPVLEAQMAGVPVVASDVSSLPEIGGNSVIYCDPKSPRSIAEAAYKLISNQELKNDIIKKGHENALRFGWDKCANLIANLLIN
ncbi:MAG TPA: glycosyltransferase family 1 protein [Candidatus Moranbacteria bacterium]|nr:glycosyltransferase family 1 protein [Candidatus Moranbacteria bacterium]